MTLSAISALLCLPKNQTEHGNEDEAKLRAA